MNELCSRAKLAWAQKTLSPSVQEGAVCSSVPLGTGKGGNPSPLQVKGTPGGHHEQSPAFSL